jgi:hypothetical protein
MAAGAAAAIANGIKASGVLVRLEPGEFNKILGRIPDPLIVTAQGGFFVHSFQYLTSYKGLAFFTKSPVALEMPNGAEIITAQSIFIPG